MAKSVNNSSNKYYFLIFLVILNLVRAIGDIILTEKYKLEENKNVIILKRFLDIPIIIITIYLFMYAKMNVKLTTLFAINLICILVDILIDHRFIYYFIHKTKQNEDTIKYLDEKVNISLISDIIVIIISFYILFKIFSFK
jgi:hypothetical protein